MVGGEVGSKISTEPGGGFGGVPASVRPARRDAKIYCDGYDRES